MTEFEYNTNKEASASFLAFISYIWFMESIIFHSKQSFIEICLIVKRATSRPIYCTSRVRSTQA